MSTWTNIRDRFIGDLERYVSKSTNDIMDLVSSLIIGTPNSYGEIVSALNSIGYDPISVFGHDFMFVYDHLYRNIMNGEEFYDEKGIFPRFTYYGDYPKIHFADPYNDVNTLLHWVKHFDEGYTVVNDGAHITQYSYAESLNKDGMSTSNRVVRGQQFNPGTRTSYAASFSYAGNLNVNDILKKTNENFQRGKYQTLIARFHTDAAEGNDVNNATQTAITRKYGMSHGRNLLKLSPNMPNGYDNPYCRVWTYHHQYARLFNTIRPFVKNDGTLANQEYIGTEFGWDAFRSSGTTGIKEFDKGAVRLDKHGVLSTFNGLVNIAPTIGNNGGEATTAPGDAYIELGVKTGDDHEGRNGEKVDIKHCMFSIENLAWKDTFNEINKEYSEAKGLSAEQKGPFGGRIMWFPPYGLSFDEQVQANWDSTNFIGRGEPIYTYTNTQRTGNLSFMLLIDHPAILDYWIHKQKDGNSYIQDNDGGVDEVDNEENALLRFFAGCGYDPVDPQDPNSGANGGGDGGCCEGGLLMAAPRTHTELEFKQKEKAPEPIEPTPDENPEDEVPDPNPNPEDEPPVEPNAKRLFVPIFYPNNYSGKNDRDANKVNPIDYLLMGVGAQMGLGADGIAYDIETDPTYTWRWDAAGIERTGYETHDHGVSYATENVYPHWSYFNESCLTDGGTVKCPPRLTKGGKDTSSILLPIQSSSGTSGITLVKQVGNQWAKTPTKTAKGGTNANWYLGKHAYRVDTDPDVINQLLRAEANGGSYIDQESHKLNSTGVHIAKSQPIMDIDEESGKDKMISLASFYVGCLGTNNNIDDVVDQNDVELARAIYNQSNGIKITKIEILGHASRDGYNTNNEINIRRNNELAMQRAETARYWLKNTVKFPSADAATTEIKNCSVEGGGDYRVPSSQNILERKIWRSAVICIYYTETEVNNVATNQKSKLASDGSDAYSSGVPVTGDALSISAGTNQTLAQSFADFYWEHNNISGNVSGSEVSNFCRTEMNPAPSTALLGEYELAAQLINQRFAVQQANTKAEEDRANSGTSAGNVIKGDMPLEDNNKSRAEKNKSSLTIVQNAKLTQGVKTYTENKAERYTGYTFTASTSNDMRYDNEGAFFQALSLSDAFLHSTTAEKIKYFDPAFHSVSPEGFNARLTFLHQCTRQGATVGGSDMNADPNVRNANNLAFGRPPVCILRIGDFYYTKIAITSMNINYDTDGIHWDLNPDGIGVMPMIAKVSITFNFLGGSDLAGPISRLQNAVSFNYYANTGVYDNRSEMAQFDKMGKVVKFKPYETPYAAPVQPPEPPRTPDGKKISRKFNGNTEEAKAIVPRDDDKLKVSDLQKSIDIQTMLAKNSRLGSREPNWTDPSKRFDEDITQL